MRSNVSIRSRAAAYSPSVMTRSPTLAIVFAASSGESGLGPDAALLEAAGVASVFFLEHDSVPAPPATTKHSAHGASRNAPRHPPTLAARGRTPSLHDIAPGILRPLAPVEAGPMARQRGRLLPALPRKGTSADVEQKALRRVVIKLSGEALSGKQGGSGIDTAMLKATAEELREVRATGVQIGLVV